MFNKLNNDDLYIARRLFQLEIHKRNGQDFENLFTKIMRLYISEFVPVKPQGSYGDRKNDGFIKSKGIYYQVYAPEDPSIKEKDTIDKLVIDFSGLYKYWNSQVTPINEFNFVLNDKYQGAYASLYPELTKIENNHAGVVCKPFLSHQLEDIFLRLPHNHIEDVLGQIPSAEDINLNVSVLNDIIQYLIGLKYTYTFENFPVHPDFEEKISFNSLGSPVANLLRYGSYQDGTLKEYFKINSTFAKDDLKQIFNNLYKEGLSNIPESNNKNDLIFFHILSNAYIKKQKVYEDAILVLMSYFFNYCDIFEEPVIKKQTTLFE
jgi:hypothetical protein